MKGMLFSTSGDVIKTEDISQANCTKSYSDENVEFKVYLIAFLWSTNTNLFQKKCQIRIIKCKPYIC